MKNYLWYRLGDNGDYCHVGDDLSALADVLIEAEVDPDFDHSPGKISCEGWDGWDYISVFWGDDEAHPDATDWLSNDEVEKLREILRSRA